MLPLARLAPIYDSLYIYSRHIILDMVARKIHWVSLRVFDLCGLASYKELEEGK